MGVAASLLALAGCGDDGSGTGGAGGDGTTSGTGGTGGQGSGPSPIGMAQVFVVNPTDATLTLSDPFDVDQVVGSTPVGPRYGEWVALNIYGDDGCVGGDSCVVFAVDGHPDVTQVFLDAKDGDELIHIVDKAARYFAASEVGEPSAGNAALVYAGKPTGFGYVDGETFVPLFDLDEVPADALVGYTDGDGGYTLVTEGGLPFIEGNRYYVDGNRTDPPSLLVCDVSHDVPAFGCFDYLLAE